MGTCASKQEIVECRNTLGVVKELERTTHEMKKQMMEARLITEPELVKIYDNIVVLLPQLHSKMTRMHHDTFVVEDALRTSMKNGHAPVLALRENFGLYQDIHEMKRKTQLPFYSRTTHEASMVLHNLLTSIWFINNVVSKLFMGNTDFEDDCIRKALKSESQQDWVLGIQELVQLRYWINHHLSQFQ